MTLVGKPGSKGDIGDRRPGSNQLFGGVGDPKLPNIVTYRAIRVPAEFADQVYWVNPSFAGKPFQCESFPEMLMNEFDDPP